VSRLHTERHLVSRIGWLRAAVLGANDKLVSTASLIVGVAAASASSSEVLISGIAEQADLARERSELSSQPAFEHEELALIYVKRGVEPNLARRVADQLMAKDALGTHARDELASRR
jgi:VIT1/CCC1 family predicted Fe2+/Mn2+ transporter